MAYFLSFIYSAVPVPAKAVNGISSELDSDLTVDDFIDLTPSQVDEDINENEIDIDDFVDIDGSKIDGEVEQNSRLDQFIKCAKSSGLAFLKLMISGAKTLKDIADLIYNIAYTSYCVAYTCMKVVVIAAKIVLLTGKVLYFTIKTTILVTGMCYRMLME